eukprot:1158457-Pelagomonas_calceolata.AAC.6
MLSCLPAPPLPIIPQSWQPCGAEYALCIPLATESTQASSNSHTIIMVPHLYHRSIIPHACQTCSMPDLFHAKPGPCHTWSIHPRTLLSFYIKKKGFTFFHLTCPSRKTGFFKSWDLEHKNVCPPGAPKHSHATAAMRNTAQVPYAMDHPPTCQTAIDIIIS